MLLTFELPTVGVLTGNVYLFKDRGIGVEEVLEAVVGGEAWFLICHNLQIKYL